MKTIGEVRQLRLKQFVAQSGLTFAEINSRLGRTRRDATLGQLAKAAPNTRTGKPRRMGDSQARLLETTFGLPTGWFDSDPDVRPDLVQPALPSSIAVEPINHAGLFCAGNSAPMSDHLVRVENLQRFKRDRKWSDADLARACNRLPQQLRTWWAFPGKGGRQIGEKLARALEEELNLPRYFLDQRPGTSAALTASDWPFEAVTRSMILGLGSERRRVLERLMLAYLDDR